VKRYLPKKRWEHYLFQECGGWWRRLLLLPLTVISWVYGAVMWIRATLYQRGVFKTRQLPCRVLSVGNITVGGTGKTPLVAALAKELQQRGMHVGILSRGYKGLKERTGGVLSDGTKIYLAPAEAGDEPFMLATMLSHVPVLVGKNRYEMGIYAVETFGVNVLILDDGFQHVRVKRDLDIVLIDSRRGFGNGHLFPRGPLREPLRSLRRASLLILTKTDFSQPLDHELTDALRSHTPTVPLYHSRYKPISLVEMASGKEFPTEFLHGKRVLAFAGIADPEYFVHILKGLGANIVRAVPFPDHHQYTTEDVRELSEYRDTLDLFVTTQKDNVKLKEIPLEGLPLFVLAIVPEILEQAFYQSVCSALSPKNE
jgi:tetraacyldisaccharide 4'-kinase